MTETRPLSTRLYCNPDRDSDGSTDQDNKSYPRERTTFNSMSSRFSDIWETDLDHKKGLFTRSLGLEFKQRKVEQRHATDDCIVNRTGQVQTTNKEEAPDENFGGKLCHPKMRAKLLFRSGDFDDKSWGYHLEETAADDIMESDDNGNKKSFDLETPANGSNGNYSPVVENISPIPFCDTEMKYDTNDTDSNNNPNGKDLNGNEFTHIQFDAGVPVTYVTTDNVVTRDYSVTTDTSVTERITDNDVTENVKNFEESKNGSDYTNNDIQMSDSGMEFDSNVEKECVMKDKPHEYDIWVTEVTHDCLTVTFMESPTEKGFFKRSYEA